MTEYVLRAATTADTDAVMRVISDAFFVPPELEPGDTYRAVMEPQRCTVVEHAGQIVGTAAVLTRDLAVPGAVVPAAHVTGVAVSATHTRRGLLRDMMTAQLTGSPEAIAVLWAAEGRIYQRFGYGLAARNMHIQLDRRELVIDRVPPGTVREIPPPELLKTLPKVYDQVQLQQPGWSSRNTAWWTHLTDDAPGRRSGRTAERAVRYDNPAGDTEGYARYRIRRDWDDQGPKGEVVVTEVVAATPDAYTALWRHLLSVDLTRTVNHGLAGLDEPLVHLVNEPRHATGHVIDSLWVRIIDLPRALTARRYAAPVDVVLSVTDSILPANAGRWRLRVRAGGAVVSCTPTTDPADLSCDIVELGAAYLGGTTLSNLASAGRVHENHPGAVQAASTAFGWHRTPSAIEVF